jgi:hypothetical protein
MVLLIRFAPGLRIALGRRLCRGECAAGSSRSLSLLSAFIWATACWCSSPGSDRTYLARYGLGGWRGRWPWAW